MMMKHLLWKDAKTIKPLFVAVLVGIVAINLTLCIEQSSMEIRLEIEFFVFVWIFLPSIFAFGAPAMLVGTEEERGTLGWLRTLPVRWQQVADSKFIVALGALAATWIVSTLGLVATTAAIGLADRWSPEEIFSLTGIASLIYFNLLVLASGFVTVYLFRSPVAGLIAVVPMVSMIAIAVGTVADWVVPSLYKIQAVGRAGETFVYTIASLLGIGLLSILWGLSRLLARRRLASPHSNLLKNLVAKESVSAYRPPSLVIPKRPNRTIALLWQHYRQVRMPCIALALLTIISWATMSVAHETLVVSAWSMIPALILMMSYFSPCWLGGLAFYGDNVNKRHRFFADRGISARSVWWTRLVTPGLCVVAILAGTVFVLALSSPSSPEEPSSAGQLPFYGATWILALPLLQFALGLLVGQWMQRGVMTFLLSPVILCVGGVIPVSVFTIYGPYTWLNGISIIVLLIGSRMLTGRWLRDQVDRGYHIRAVGCCLLAVALPVITLFGWRIWTTPASMPQWRAKMLTEKLPEQAIATASGLVQRDWILDWNTFVVNASRSTKNVTNANVTDMLRDELASDGIGQHIALYDINMLVFVTGENPREKNSIESGPDQQEINELAIEVLLKWARFLREAAIASDATLHELEAGAEISESLAIDRLSSMTLHAGAIPGLKRLVDSIPDRELRKESRRVALVGAWRAYDSTSWIKGTGDAAMVRQKTFPYQGLLVAHQVSGFPFERIRADRFIDKLVKLTLFQLDNGLPVTCSSAGYVERAKLRLETMAPNEQLGPVGENVGKIGFGQHWTEEYEQQIERLRKRYADVKLD